MSTSKLELARVSALLQQVVAELVLPSFRRLGPADIELKLTPGLAQDVVSRVDREVEAWLGPRLRELVPGSVVIGEEAAHADPRVLDALSSAPWAWLIDPIDGTRGFVDGTDHFGVMIALLERGQTRAAWIDLPARGQSFVAEAGAGAYRDGERLRVPLAETGALRGNLYTTFMTAPVRDKVEAWAPGRFTPGEPSGCAALEYTNLAQGRKDFVVYHRILPWDHAPGALILAESGGSVLHVDGRSYAPANADQLTVCAGSTRASATVRQWLLE
ncbi:MAG: inositol monophosphatase [Polyangiaceae bacterium]